MTFQIVISKTKPTIVNQIKDICLYQDDLVNKLSIDLPSIFHIESGLDATYAWDPLSGSCPVFIKF